MWIIIVDNNREQKIILSTILTIYSTWFFDTNLYHVWCTSYWRLPLPFIVCVKSWLFVRDHLYMFFKRFFNLYYIISVHIPVLILCVRDYAIWLFLLKDFTGEVFIGWCNDSDCLLSLLILLFLRDYSIQEKFLLDDVMTQIVYFHFWFCLTATQIRCCLQ
jgi:hypothetical protein